MVTAIAHAAWAPGRKKSLATLLEQVPGALVVTSQTKEHARVWAPRLWKAAYDLAKPDEWCSFLNDDVTVAPDHAIEAMLSVVPEHVTGVSLATIQPQARAAYDRGQCFLASYLATGPGYSLRRKRVGELLAFHSETLTEGMRAQMNEDEVLSHFAWSLQLPFWQCLPALVAHDVGVKSTLGYDNHPGRVASLLWTEAPIREWRAGEPTFVPHPWLGEGRIKAVRRAYQHGWSFNEVCVFCAERPILILSPNTGAGLCGQCLADAVGHVLVNARIG